MRIAATAGRQFRRWLQMEPLLNPFEVHQLVAAGCFAAGNASLPQRVVVKSRKPATAQRVGGIGDAAHRLLSVGLLNP